MKKFIISFQFMGRVYSARVIAYKLKGRLIISTDVLHSSFFHPTADLNLIFIPYGKGYRLFHVEEDGTTIPLTWKIKLEFVDKYTPSVSELFHFG
jgi:hypothetical protein